MPLHRGGKLLGARHMDGLDQTVLGVGQWLQAFTQAIDGLAVQGVDRKLFFADQFGQPAARNRTHLVGVAVLHLDRIIGVFTMVVETRDLVGFLVDIAAQGHVDFLHATADTKQRDTAFDRRTDQRNIEQVAILVLALVRGQVVLAIEDRVDIAAGTGQVDAIDHGQVLLQVIDAAATGGQERHATGNLSQGRYVFVGHDLIGVALALLGAHGHQDNGFALGSGSVRIVVGHTSP